MPPKKAAPAAKPPTAKRASARAPSTSSKSNKASSAIPQTTTALTSKRKASVISNDEMEPATKTKAKRSKTAEVPEPAPPKTKGTKRKASGISNDEMEPATKSRAKRPKTAVVAPKPSSSKTKATKPAPEAKAILPKKAVKPVVPAKVNKPAPKRAAAAAVKKPSGKGAIAKKAPVPKKVLTKNAGVKKNALADANATAKTPKAPKNLAPPKKALPPKKVLPDINFAPTQVMQIYVFGEGSAGELGLGAKIIDGKNVIDVTRPRLNANLEKIGVVQLAVGGMHCAALSHDNKIYTWGVNDSGALGRVTSKEGKMKTVDPDKASDDDSDSDSDSDDEDSGLNPSEAEPGEVDPKHFPEGTKFAALFAADSTTFALTTTGTVYGWGSFRGNEGELGFKKGVPQQHTPVLIPELKGIKTMATGTNHVLAVNDKGKVFAWGAGEQSQLARRVVARTAIGALTPREFGFKRQNIVDVACGDYHCFAKDNNGTIYSWGLNTFGQTGVAKENDADDTVTLPTIVENLGDYDVKQLAGGAHHSIACTKDGKVLIWGRIDGGQAGVDINKMPKDFIYWDEQSGVAKYLEKPHVVPDIEGTCVATATDTCIAVSNEGKAYSWGFSENYQTGQGSGTQVEEATLIDNSAVRGKKLVFTGVGGQFAVLGGVV